MIMTDNEAIAQKCSSLRNLCFVPEKRFVHYELGYNYRMTNLQAAIGLAQLERLDEFIVKKRQIGKLYKQNLSHIDGFRFPVDKTDYADNIYWVFAMVIEKERKWDNERMMQELSTKGVGSRPFFWCAHEQPVFQNRYASTEFKESEYISRHGFYLPSGLGITEEEINYVSEVLINIAKK
jgi:perosamine synthetase